MGSFWLYSKRKTQQEQPKHYDETYFRYETNKTRLLLAARVRSVNQQVSFLSSYHVQVVVHKQYIDTGITCRKGFAGKRAQYN